MKLIPTIILLFLTCQVASATEWLQYFIYHETQYMQGPWIHGDNLGNPDQLYLEARLYEDNFGTVPQQVVETVISRLREDKPSTYDWPFTAEVRNDTVILNVEKNISIMETVRNELTASLVFNQFSTVVFRMPDSEMTWNKDDITLPYFDLVTAYPAEAEGELPPGKPQEESPEEDPSQKSPLKDNAAVLRILLAVSVILNAMLLFLYFRKKY